MWNSSRVLENCDNLYFSSFIALEGPDDNFAKDREMHGESNVLSTVQR